MTGKKIRQLRYLSIYVPTYISHWGNYKKKSLLKQKQLLVLINNFCLITDLGDLTCNMKVLFSLIISPRLCATRAIYYNHFAAEQ